LFLKSGYLAGRVDLLLIVLLSCAFGLHVVVHVTLVIALLRRRPWWRGLVALVLSPLAPFWGYEARLRARVALWIGTLIIYLASLTAAAL
jgi:hypothetical protein